MADVRELLGRLSAATVRFDTGRGGLPELTPQDVAGALGMVAPGLGRDFLEFLHGPSMGVCPSARCKVRADLCRLALNHAHCLRWAAIDARAVVEIARINAQLDGDKSAASRDRLRSLERAEARARDQQWPDKLGEKVMAIADIVIDHMRGERLANVARAKRLGIDESTYRERWARVVDALLTEVIEAEQAAAAELKVALRHAAVQ